MEKKELRAKIIALKKSSGKGAVSKERKKEIQAEILELEESLKQLEIVKDEPVGQNDETVNSLATSSQNQEPSPTKKKKKERKVFNEFIEQIG